MEKPAPAARMPVLFIGHGSPENAVENNAITRNWKALAAHLPRPAGILCVSAHWLTEGTAVTAMKHPRTIHDFYGFPRALYAVEYAAPGSPELAEKVRGCVSTLKVEPDAEWGLDHGTWSVLANMYPAADIPVVQLSLNYYLPPEKQYRIGAELAALRDEGILILGSGNLVHNLAAMDWEAAPYDWAVAFDSFVAEAMARRDDDALIHYAEQSTARLAHPTYDHYLPLLYALGASAGEKPQSFNAEFFGGSVSMRSAAFGAIPLPL